MTTKAHFATIETPATTTAYTPAVTLTIPLDEACALALTLSAVGGPISTGRGQVSRILAALRAVGVKWEEVREESRAALARDRSTPRVDRPLFGPDPLAVVQGTVTWGAPVKVPPQVFERYAAAVRAAATGEAQ